jgi:D-3-phosphoglycerate dehydrogenase / 2-oxoglutarate reductase
MQVGRLGIGGQAIMILRIDKPLTKNLIDLILQIDNIQSLHEIDL